IGIANEAVLVLDQEPVLLVGHAHERIRALDLLAAQEESELALLQPLSHAPLGLFVIVEPVLIALVRAVDAAIPHDHFTRAVLAGGNYAFERRVVERVIFGLRGEALFARIKRRSF